MLGTTFKYIYSLNEYPLFLSIYLIFHPFSFSLNFYNSSFKYGTHFNLHFTNENMDSGLRAEVNYLETLS